MLKLLNILLLCIIVFLIFILSFSETRLSYRFKKNLVLIATILISIICGVSVIGLDHLNYIEFFEMGPIVTLDYYFITTMFDNHLEPFFVVLISLLKQFNLGYGVFLIISVLLPMLIIYSLVTKKENSLPITTLSFFLLLCLFRGPVDTLRHFFAAVIYLSAIYSLSKEKKISFYAQSLFSVLVHYSNIAIIFIRPFLNIKWSRLKYAMAIAFGLFLILVFKDLLLTYVANAHFTNSAFAKFKFYLLYLEENRNYNNSLHKFLLFVFTYWLFIFNIIVNFIALGNGMRKQIYSNKFYGLLLNSQIIGSLLVVFFVVFNAGTLGLRLNYLFSIGSFFLIKEMIFNYYKGDKKVLFIPVILFLVIYNIIIILYFLGIHDPTSRFRMM